MRRLLDNELMNELKELKLVQGVILLTTSHRDWRFCASGAGW